MSHVTDALVTKLASEASADRRSITRVLAGLPVRGMAGERIRRALEAHGLSPAPLALATPSAVAAVGSTPTRAA